MVKIPAKIKRSIESELKKFIPIFSNLAAKGKATSEDDARIILNDVLSYVLGYDKYNELKTEQREKNGRLDYLVTLNEGPKKKKGRADFVIEAKAVHVCLNQHHVDQTLSYCLTAGLDYFFLTNVLHWQLYQVKRSKKSPQANLIYEVNFSGDNNSETLAEEFYIFSKASYLARDWDTISEQVKATNESDILAVLLSDRMIKRVCKQLEEIHGARVSDEMVKEIIETKIIRADILEINKSLLKKLNTKPERAARENAPVCAAMESRNDSFEEAMSTNDAPSAIQQEPGDTNYPLKVS